MNMKWYDDTWFNFNNFSKQIRNCEKHIYFVWMYCSTAPKMAIALYDSTKNVVEILIINIYTKKMLATNIAWRFGKYIFHISETNHESNHCFSLYETIMEIKIYVVRGFETKIYLLKLRILWLCSIFNMQLKSSKICIEYHINIAILNNI